MQCVDYTLLLKVYNHFFFFFCIEEVLKFYYYFFFISCCYPICLVSMPQIPLPISNLCFFTLEQSPFKGIWPGSHFFFFFLAFNFHSIQFGTLKRMRDGGEKKNRLFFFSPNALGGWFSNSITEKSMLRDWAHLSNHTIGFDFKVQQRVTDMNHLIYELEHRPLDTYESLMERSHNNLLLQPKNENTYLQIHFKIHCCIIIQLLISILSHYDPYSKIYGKYVVNSFLRKNIFF